jgi:thiaminase/transcriptional activator TenA
MNESWTTRLWSRVEHVYAAILTHPFHVGLISGKLDDACFGYYVAQDVHYLRDYARALAILGAKAPDPTLTAMFTNHAAGTALVEGTLHDSLLAELGLDVDDVYATPKAPCTAAYGAHLLAAVSQGSFAEGLAAVLPCYWLYQRVGDDLVAQGSPDPRYQKWINTYTGHEYPRIVADVLHLADEVGAEAGPAERQRAELNFVTTSRYEWMLPDAAYRREEWPI